MANTKKPNEGAARTKAAVMTVHSAGTFKERYAKERP